MYIVEKLGLKNAIIAVALIGLIIRLLFAPFFTMGYDFSFWQILCDYNDAGLDLYEVPHYFYTPVWGYICIFIGRVFDFLGVVADPMLIVPFNNGYISVANSLVTAPVFNLAIKTPLIIGDLVVGYLIYQLARSYGISAERSFIAYTAWILCPLVIWTSSIQGQFETLSVMFLVAALFCLQKNKYVLSGICFGLSCALKIFPGILFPTIAIMIWASSKDKKVNNLALFLVGSTIAFIVSFIPVLFEGDFIASLGFFTSRVMAINDGSGKFIRWDIIIFLIPILIILQLYVAKKYLLSDSENDEIKICCISLAMFCFFGIPIASPISHYLLISLPFLVLMMHPSNRIVTIAYILMSVIGIIELFGWTGMEMMLPLAVFTDWMNLESLELLCQNYDSLLHALSNFVVYLTFLPCFILAIYIFNKLGEKNDAD